MLSVGFEHHHPHNHHHHHHHHRDVQQQELSRLFGQHRGSSGSDARGDTGTNSSRYHHNQLGSSTSLPHLRHQHHSRNHGINGTSSFSRFNSNNNSSSSISPRKMLSFSESERSTSDSLRTMFPERNEGGGGRGGGGGASESGSGAFPGENETFSQSSRFLTPSAAGGTNRGNNIFGTDDQPMATHGSKAKNGASLLLVDHLEGDEKRNFGGGGSGNIINMNNSSSATSFVDHNGYSNNGTIILNNFAPNNKSLSGSPDAIGKVEEETGGSGESVTNNYYLSTRNFNSGGGTSGHISPFNYSFDEMLGEGGGILQMENNDNASTGFMYNSTSLLDGVNGTGGDATVSIRGNLYASIVPVMLFFCVLAVLVNLLIVISARWCRKPMSPTLYFSISLALADAYAAFILATGLVINSLLPFVFGYQGLPICLSLVVEAFRQGGVLVTVSHLLALAMNHWIGIVRPLHYAATMTRRTAWTVIIFSWICPITMIFIYYSSVAGEGFQSPGCVNYNFLKERAYRAFFASCFFAPLILMSFIYIHIFIIVRNHHTHRQRFQSTQQLKRNIKAVLTTMLVLGTYIIGWMPAILFSLIACSDCIYDTEDLPSVVRYSIGFTTNLLVILKTLVDPVIYAARMSDIQMALKKMRYDILATFCKSCAPPAPPNDRGYYLNSPSGRTSFYESKSMRMSQMSSFGSRSSSRRMMMTNNSSAAHTAVAVAAANANLLLHSSGGGGGSGCGGGCSPTNQLMHHHHNHFHNHNNQQSHKVNGNAGATNGYIVTGSPLSESYPRSHPNGHSGGGGGASRRSFGNHQQILINGKAAFEMAEMN